MFIAFRNSKLGFAEIYLGSTPIRESPLFLLLVKAPNVKVFDAILEIEVMKRCSLT